MPAYNVERTLASALQSILAQTYKRIEVILVDDGSIDGTSRVAAALAADERVVYVRNEKQMGGYQTMNRAMSLATGAFVAVYHSDDLYDPAIVEKELAYLEGHPAAGAVFAMDHFMDDSTGSIFGGASLPADFAGRDSLTYEDVFPFLLRRKNVLFCCPTFMARREALDAVGPFDAARYDIAADLDMWLRISRRFPVGILDERLMRYRIAKSQWSSRHNYLRTSEELYFRVMDDHMDADGWRGKLREQDLTEYEFHRRDDETFRACNYVIRGEPAMAAELLGKPFPWKTLIRWRRRKFRVVLLRMVMKAALAAGAVRSLAALLLKTEYGGPLKQV
ncbi:MAG TPA: glycosyltransferase [Bryobacteraceae bacterium]|jgi:glycosyltransferase involved in cell wall biosynthesis|nr:glycosyltransferase [Bryobacteraceae bacterium]